MSQIASPPPTFARAGVTPGWDKLKIIDVQTGATITGVIEADAEKGRVLRRDLDEAGNLKIVDDRIVTIEEEREIRTEWIVPEQAAPAADVTTVTDGSGEAA